MKLKYIYVKKPNVNEIKIYKRAGWFIYSTYYNTVIGACGVTIEGARRYVKIYLDKKKCN